MERLEFVRSRGKNALRLLVAVPLIALCVWLALDPGQSVVYRAFGWVATAFFGLASLVGVKNVVRGGTVFAFDSGGITDYANALVIPWNEIEECRVVSIRGALFIGLVFRHPDQFLERLSSAKRVMSRLDERTGTGQWAFSFSDVSPDIDAALDFIQRHAPSVRTPAT